MKNVGLAVGLLGLILPTAPAFAQASSGTVSGAVFEPSGAAIPGATVEIQNPVSHYNRTATTGPQGKFQFDNIPFNNYHTTASARGFQSGEQDINVRSAIPVELNYTLKIGTASTQRGRGRVRGFS
jgi:hypothetical protein